MVGGETSGGPPELGARVERASRRTAGLVERMRSGSAPPGEVAEAVAELSALRTLLEGGDRRLLGRVTARLGALLALRYATGQGTQEDRKRAQLLLREVRDPSAPAGEDVPAEEKRWAALFLLMASDLAAPGGSPGVPASFWPVIDQIRQAGTGTVAAGGAELVALTEEAAELPLPPHAVAKLRQMHDIVSSVQSGGLSDPQALLGMLPPDFPFRDELRSILGVLAGVPGTAPPPAGRTPEPDAADAGTKPDADAGTEQKDVPLDPVLSSWLSSMAGAVETLRTGDPESLNRTLGRLGTELDQPADPGDRAQIQNLMRLVLQMGRMFSASRQDEEVAGDHLGRMVGYFEEGPDFDPASQLGVGARLIALLTEAHRAEQADSQPDLERLTAELEALERTVPADHPFRWMALLALGSTRSTLAVRTGDKDQIRRGIAQQEEGLARAAHLGLPGDLTAQLQNGLRTADAWLGRDRGLLPAQTPVPPEASTESHYGAALAAAVRYSLTREPADLDAAIGGLEHVRHAVRQGRSPHLAADALRQLAENYRTRLSLTHDPADREAATQAALESLQALAGDVVLQTGPEHGLLTAREGADLGVRTAIWAASQGRVADAVAALELGRALVLQAASTSRAVPELLEDRGHPELARAWRSAGADGGPDSRALPRELPSSLRHRALKALGHRDPEGALFRTPTVGELGAAVAQGGADALVYLLAGQDDLPGMAVVVSPDGTQVRALPQLSRKASGPLERYLDAAAGRQRTGAESAVRAWEDALVELCDWAAGAAVVPVLTGVAKRLAADGAARRRGRSGPARLVLVPCGRLGIVPWHAARIPSGATRRYACEAVVISYAASGRQFADSVRRARRAPEADPVLVADPSLTLPHVELEVTALYDACYPRARLLGELYEPPVEPEAPGTPEDVLHALDGAPSLLHVACHGSAGTSPTASALQLAQPGTGTRPAAENLTVARLLEHRDGDHGGDRDRDRDRGRGRGDEAVDGPLVVLSACETDLSNRDHDEALTLTTAFLSRGARDVVGSRWAVQSSAAALMMAAFHHYLRVDGHSPVDALRAAQRWMLDPDRRKLESLGGRLLHELGKVPRLDHPAAWAAFTHQGHPGPAGT